MQEQRREMAVLRILAASGAAVRHCGGGKALRRRGGGGGHPVGQAITTYGDTYEYQMSGPGCDDHQPAVA
jgi:hypothetical protein